MSEHTYPSDYPPGTHWAIDEAWAILDRLQPGILDHDIRAFLAGLIAGTLTRVVAETVIAETRRGLSNAPNAPEDEGGPRG